MPVVMDADRRFEGRRRNGRLDGRIDGPIFDGRTVPERVARQVERRFSREDDEGLRRWRAIGLSEPQPVVVRVVVGRGEIPAKRLRRAAQRITVGRNDEGLQRGQPQETVQQAARLLVVIDEVDLVAVTRALRERFWTQQQRAVS